MKKILLTLTLLCLSSLGFSTHHDAQEQALDRIVAVVNDGIIMQSELNQAMHDARLQMQAIHQPTPAPASLRKKVLNDLINQHIQLQLAKKNKITVTAAQIDQAIANIAKNNGLDHAAFITRLKQSGIDIDHYRDEIKKQMIMAKLQGQAVGATIQLTDDDVRAFIRRNQSQQHLQFHVVDVLIPLKSSSTSAEISTALKQASQVRQALVSGQSTDSVAKQFPSITTSDMGYRTAASLPDLFVQSVKSLSKNAWSKPIQASNGFHLLKVVNSRRPKMALSFDQAKSVVRRQAYAKAVEKWLKQLRDTSYVKINP